MHRPGEFVVEEVGEADHPETGGVQNAKVRCLALEILRPFDRKQRSHGPDAVRTGVRAIAVAASALTDAVGEEAIDVGCGADNPQFAPARRLGAAQLLGVPQRAFEQAAPCPHRL